MISYRDLRNCHMTLKLQDVNVHVSMKGSEALKYIKAKETFQSN